MDVWMDELMDRWMSGVDGWIDRQIDGLYR